MQRNEIDHSGRTCVRPLRRTGTRFREQTEFRPKPMIEIGGKPILGTSCTSMPRDGFKRFVLCLGYKAEMIKEYFLHYASLNSDFTVELATNALTTHSMGHSDDWEVTLADTGEPTMTGPDRESGRQISGNAEHFAVTYGDGLTDADLAAEFRFHLEHGRVGTVLGVNPPSRFGEFDSMATKSVSLKKSPSLTRHGSTAGISSFGGNF